MVKSESHRGGETWNIRSFSVSTALLCHRKKNCILDLFKGNDVRIAACQRNDNILFTWQPKGLCKKYMFSKTFNEASSRKPFSTDSMLSILNSPEFPFRSRGSCSLLSRSSYAAPSQMNKDQDGPSERKCND